MKKSSVLFLLLVSFFDLSNTMASVNNALTVWGVNVIIKNLKNGDRIRTYVNDELKKNNLYEKTTTPSVDFRFIGGENSIRFIVSSVKYKSIFFEKIYRFDISDKNITRKKVEEMVGDFKRLIPYKALIYSVSGNNVIINAGSSEGLSKGKVLRTISYVGNARLKSNLDKYSFSYKTTGVIEVIAVRKNSAICKIKSQKPKKFDKIIFSSEKKIKRSSVKLSKFFFGSIVPYTVHKTVKELTVPDSPDSGKKLKYASLIPFLGLEYWVYDKIVFDLELSYRKIPVTLLSGKKKKATYFMSNIDLIYPFKINMNNYSLFKLGYFLYNNTIDEKHIYYISSKYSGVGVGFEWQRFIEDYVFWVGFKLYPSLTLKEPLVQRGEKSNSNGFLIDLGWEYLFTNVFGLGLSGQYRVIKSSFTGDTSVGINPDDTYTETHYGIKLVFIVALG